MIVNKVRHGGLELEIGDTIGLWHDFSSNINPLGPPTYLWDLLQKNLYKITSYPEANNERSKKEIALHLRISPKNISVGNGCMELIYTLARLKLWKSVTLVSPTFSEYSRALAINGIEIRYCEALEQNQFQPNLNELIDKTEAQECLWLCNPNNPTGHVFSRSELIEIAQQLKEKKAFLVIDESFIDFSQEESLSGEILYLDNLIILKSLTKIYSLPGLRLGYAIANPQIIAQMENLFYPWNMNTFAHLVLPPLLKDLKFLENSHRLNRENRFFLNEQLKTIPWIQTFPSDANYLFCKIQESNFCAAQLNLFLAKHKIKIREAANFQSLNKSFFRIAVKDFKSNKKLIHCLKQVSFHD